MWWRPEGPQTTSQHGASRCMLISKATCTYAHAHALMHYLLVCSVSGPRNASNVITSSPFRNRLLQSKWNGTASRPLFGDKGSNENLRHKTTFQEKRGRWRRQMHFLRWEVLRRYAWGRMDPLANLQWLMPLSVFWGYKNVQFVCGICLQWL